MDMKPALRLHLDPGVQWLRKINLLELEEDQAAQGGLVKDLELYFRGRLEGYNKCLVPYGFRRLSLVLCFRLHVVVHLVCEIESETSPPSKRKKEKKERKIIGRTRTTQWASVRSSPLTRFFAETTLTESLPIRVWRLIAGVLCWAGEAAERGCGAGSVGVEMSSSIDTSVESSTDVEALAASEDLISDMVMFWYFCRAVIIKVILEEEFARFLKMSSMDLSGVWLMPNTLAIFSAFLQDLDKVETLSIADVSSRIQRLMEKIEIEMTVKVTFPPPSK